MSPTKDDAQEVRPKRLHLGITSTGSYNTTTARVASSLCHSPSAAPSPDGGARRCRHTRQIRALHVDTLDSMRNSATNTPTTTNATIDHTPTPSQGQDRATERLPRGPRRLPTRDLGGGLCASAGTRVLQELPRPPLESLAVALLRERTVRAEVQAMVARHELRRNKPSEKTRNNGRIMTHAISRGAWPKLTNKTSVLFSCSLGARPRNPHRRSCAEAATEACVSSLRRGPTRATSTKTAQLLCLHAIAMPLH